MSSMLGSERRDVVLSLLSENGSVKLEEAAEILGVSVMTVRRDLAELEADGLARRVRGGAVAQRLPQPFAARISARTAAKSEIARKALALMPRDGAIAVDASSTGAVLLGALRGEQELLVATNSAESATIARGVPGTRSVLIGGELDEQTGSFVGATAVRAAGVLGYRRFFSSSAAVHTGFGSSEVSLEEAAMKRAFMSASDETVLLVDASKLDGRAAAQALDWSEVGVLVTDLAPGDSRLDAYRGLVELL